MIEVLISRQSGVLLDKNKADFCGPALQRRTHDVNLSGEIAASLGELRIIPIQVVENNNNRGDGLQMLNRVEEEGEEVEDVDDENKSEK